jgi:LPXTG-motif cell wall-anchored protein
VGTSFGTLSDLVKVTPAGGGTTTTTTAPSSTTPTTIRASATPDTTTTTVDATETLPRTGAVTTHSVQWAALVLLFGLAAIGIGWRRHRSA